MNPVCVAIYDKKAQVFQCPAFVADLAAAERSFVQIFTSGDTTISQWPDDFDLYQLGSVMPGTGELVPLDRPALVITGQSAILALSRMRRLGGELSGGSKLTPPEDSEASAERNKTLSDGLQSGIDTAPAH